MGVKLRYSIIIFMLCIVGQSGAQRPIISSVPRTSHVYHSHDGSEFYVHVLTLQDDGFSTREYHVTGTVGSIEIRGTHRSRVEIGGSETFDESGALAFLNEKLDEYWATYTVHVSATIGSGIPYVASSDNGPDWGSIGPVFVRINSGVLEVRCNQTIYSPAIESRLAEYIGICIGSDSTGPSFTTPQPDIGQGWTNNLALSSRFYARVKYLAMSSDGSAYLQIYRSNNGPGSLFGPSGTTSFHAYFRSCRNSTPVTEHPYGSNHIYVQVNVPTDNRYETGSINSNNPGFSAAINYIWDLFFKNGEIIPEVTRRFTRSELEGIEYADYACMAVYDFIDHNPILWDLRSDEYKNGTRYTFSDQITMLGLIWDSAIYTGWPVTRAIDRPGKPFESIPGIQIECVVVGFKCENTQQEIRDFISDWLDYGQPTTPAGITGVHLDLEGVGPPNIDIGGRLEVPAVNEFSARIVAAVTEFVDSAQGRFPFGLGSWIPGLSVGGPASSECGDIYIPLLGINDGIGWCDLSVHQYVSATTRAGFLLIILIAFYFSTARTVAWA